MHYIFRSNVLGYRNGLIQAIIQNPMDWRLSPVWHAYTSVERLAGQFGPFQFEVREDVPHPDNYWTGAAMELYSERLLSLLVEGTGIQYETFEAEILGRRSKRRILEDYRVFRLLEIFPYIDAERTVLADDGFRIKEAVVYEGVESKAPDLFIDDRFRNMIFISARLKKSIEDQGITGCQFLTLPEYLDPWSLYLKEKVTE